MPKRVSEVALEDLSGDEQGHAPQKKRSRLGDATNRLEVGGAQARAKQERLTQQQNKSRRQQDDEDGEEHANKSDDEGDMLEAEDADQHIQDVLQRKMEAQQQRAGRIGDMGIIETLKMTNFMCHKSLNFTFGPQMNFIIGHNGSGKSAALSALTIALGGKAASTGRGKGLAGYIKEGETQSTIIVGIKNQGDEAYRPEVYGPRIYVERRFTSTGGSYKIMSSAMKLISTTRRELDSICDHMNIQVDNPMNVLTQDSARQFLSASGAKDKYKFFMEGTQLAQLNRTYEELEEKVDGFTHKYQLRAEGVRDYQEKLDDALQRREAAERVREMDKNLERLNAELAWAHVAGKRKELEEAMKPHKKAKKKVDAHNVQIGSSEAAVLAATANLEALDGKLPTEMSDDERAELGRIKEELKKIKQEMTGIKGDKKNINADMSRLGRQDEELRLKISAEETKLAAATQGVVEAFRERIRSKESLVNQLAEDGRTQDGLIRSAGEDLERIRTEGTEWSASRERLRDDVQRIQGAIASQQNVARDKLNVFGMGVQGVIDEIGKMQWNGQVMKGPVGLFMTLKKEHANYARALRNVLGHQLRAWVVSDHRDRRALADLLKRAKIDAQIIISPIDIFEFSHKEPPPDVLTVLRAFDVTDQWALRVLINQARIEQLALAPTRQQAEQLGQRAGVSRLLSADEFQVTLYLNEGGKQSIALGRLQQGDPRNLLLNTSGDPQAQIRELEEEKTRALHKLAEIEQNPPDAGGKMRALHQQLEGAKRARVEIQRKIASEKVRLDQLKEEANAAQPVSVSGYEEQRQAIATDRARLTTQFEDMIAREQAIGAGAQELVERQKVLKAREDATLNEAAVVQQQMTVAAEARAQARKDLEHWQRGLAQAMAEEKECADRADILTKEYLRWKESAQRYSADEIRTKRTVADIKNKIDACENMIADHNRRQGATVEQIDQEVQKALEDYEKYCGDVKEMKSLAHDMQRGMRQRQIKWQIFRKSMAIRCKFLFMHHLSNRGYEGKIVFDHVNGKLALRVRTEAAMTDQGQSKRTAATKDKDPKSLSGGEKSFSTICLLLSLWESIGCPIRCLDEFDVFMDAVNRRVSMKMMVDTANAADSKQFILISPLDMSNVAITDCVRVHKMADPERGVAQ